MHLKTLHAVLLLACIRLQGAEGNFSGYEFVFSVPFVPNVDYADNPHVMISTQSRNLVHATVTIPLTEFEVDTDVTRNQYADIKLPNSVYLVGTGKQMNKTVIVRSSGEASVHVMANEGGSGDGFLVLPTGQLGTEHYVLSYIPASMGYPSFICVSALSEATTVDILTRKTGQTHRVVLGEYESYQLVGGNYEDFSGSQIVSDHAVTVVSGTRVSYVGSGPGGVLVEQMLPVQSWGTNVAISPFMGKENGCVYRVLGTNYTTSVTISSVGTVTLTEGQWYEEDVTDNTMVTIASDYPILVMQYIKGRGSMPSADPSMILVPSTNMYTNNITFPVYYVTLSTNIYYIHAIVDCNYVNGLIYDDHISMADWELLTTADGDMCAVRGTVSPGTVHSIGHPDEGANFTVAVYGLVSDGQPTASYAYPAGIRDLGTDEQPSTAEPTVTDEHSSTESPVTKPALGNELVGLDLQCEGTSMRAFFNTSVLPFKQASDVHLRDPDCSATDYGDGWAMVYTDYHLCRTEMTETPTHIVYRNELIFGPDNPYSIIIPIQNKTR